MQNHKHLIDTLPRNVSFAAQYATATGWSANLKLLACNCKSFGTIYYCSICNYDSIITIDSRKNGPQNTEVWKSTPIKYSGVFKGSISNIPVTTAVDVNTTGQFEICFLKPHYFHHFTKNNNTQCRTVKKFQPSICVQFAEGYEPILECNNEILIHVACIIPPFKRRLVLLLPFKLAVTGFDQLWSTVWATANWFSSAVSLTGLPVIDVSMTNPVNSNLSWCSQTAATLGVSDETALLNIKWLHQHSPFHNTFLNTYSAPHTKFHAHCDNNMLHKTEYRYNTDNHKIQRSYITYSTAIKSSDVPQIAWLKYKRQSERNFSFFFISYCLQAGYVKMS